MTAVAIGPATSPPVQPWHCSIIAATATCGSSAGAKPMNHGRLIPAATSISAVPVLPANDTPPTERPAAVPSSVTLTIISVTCWAVSSLTTPPAVSGSSSSIVRPSGSLASSSRFGFIRSPPLAIAAATSAICIGVIAAWPSSPPCPMATRPTSKPDSTRSPAWLRTPLAIIWPSG